MRRAEEAQWLACERHARSRRSLSVLRAEITGWLTARCADQAFARFTGHFHVLGHVLGRMLDAVAAELDQVDAEHTPSGAVYEQCRAAEQRLGLIRRTHGWYAEKYDQRLDDGQVLRAADEVVRSCWVGAFDALDRRPPTGPLVHLDSRFDAVATPRVSVPADLRAPRDAVVGEFVRELPIPVIALPAVCVDEPWWLVLAAHETGHHVQHDLSPGLVGHTRDALAACVAGSGEDRAACWSAWSMEAFADAFAMLTVGPATAWAVGELEHASPSRLIMSPSPASRYPPPAVRAALLGELARVVGAPDGVPGAADVLRWVDAADVDPTARDAVAAHVRLAPGIAATLVDLPVDGVPMRTVCGWEADTFAATGPVGRWAAALQSAQPVVSGRSLPAAARHAVAGGVAAYRTLARRGAGRTDREALDRLRTTLPAALATCGPTGHLAAGPTRDLEATTRRLTALLLAAHDDGAP